MLADADRRKVRDLVADLDGMADRLERARLKAPPDLGEALAALAGRLADATALIGELTNADPEDAGEEARQAGRALRALRRDALAIWFDLRTSGPWQAETLLGMVVDGLPEVADAVEDLATILEIAALTRGAE
jgi:hypothetical protein